MQLYWKKQFILIFLAVLILGGKTVSAIPINITNFSFEDPVHNDSAFSNVATGWVVTGDSGTWNPTVSQLAQGPTDGLQVGFSNQTGLGLSQILSDVLLPNRQYTLNVDALSRTDGIIHQSSILELRTSDDILLASASVGPITRGINGLLTATYFAGIDDPYLGKSLKIALLSNGTQSNWDNVRLDATVVPVPAAIWLFVSGLIGLIGMKKVI